MSWRPESCQVSVETESRQPAWRRCVEGGWGVAMRHTAVELALEGKKTAELAALALFDDETQGGRVLGEINRKWGKSAGDAYRDCQRGTHQGFSGSLLDLVNESLSLAGRLRQLT